MEKKQNSKQKVNDNEYNHIAHRLILVRQFRNMKQAYVGQFMGITQQAYSILENSKGSIGINTLLRFCKATDVSMELLLATSVPITQENIDFFNANKMETILSEYRSMQQKLKFYESMISVRMAS